MLDQPGSLILSFSNQIFIYERELFQLGRPLIDCNYSSFIEAKNKEDTFRDKGNKTHFDQVSKKKKKTDETVIINFSQLF